MPAKGKYNEYRAVASTVSVVRPKGEVRFASGASEKILPLIELNASVPQEGLFVHCCSLHGKPLSVSNSEYLYSQYT